MPNGEFAAKELVRKRKKQRLLNKGWKRKKLKLKQKYDAVGTVPMAKALVLQKFVLQQKQPHSGKSALTKIHHLYYTKGI